MRDYREHADNVELGIAKVFNEIVISPFLLEVATPMTLIGMSHKYALCGLIHIMMFSNLLTTYRIVTIVNTNPCE